MRTVSESVHPSGAKTGKLPEGGLSHVGEQGRAWGGSWAAGSEASQAPFDLPGITLGRRTPFKTSSRKSD